MKYKLITDGRTLRPLINAGVIKEAYYGAFPQIDSIEYSKTTFIHKGISYLIKYVDGSIYPLLFKAV